MRKLLFALIVSLWAVPVEAQLACNTADAGGNGTGFGSTTNLTYPTTLEAGDIALLFIANKGNAPDAVANFTVIAQVNGGDGGSGADTGNVWSTIAYDEVDGTEDSGALTVTTTGTALGIYAKVIRCMKTAATWSLAATTGTNATEDTSWNVTGAGDPGFQNGDMIVFIAGKDNDAATFASHTLSAGGSTVGAITEAFDNGSSVGDDVGLVFGWAAISGSASAGAPVHEATTSTGTAGSGAVLRLREVAAGGSTAKCTPGGGMMRPGCPGEVQE